MNSKRARRVLLFATAYGLLVGVGCVLGWAHPTAQGMGFFAFSGALLAGALVL